MTADKHATQRVIDTWSRSPRIAPRRRTAREHVVLAGSATLVSCSYMVPYTPLVRSARGEDPDAVYSAAVSVLERKGWGIMLADRTIHEVRTQWFPFRDIGLAAGSDEGYAAAWRVTVGNGRIEVFTACTRHGEPDRSRRAETCPEDERPQGLREKELELAADILDEAHARQQAAPAAARSTVTTGAADKIPTAMPAAPAPVTGCVDDIECKGDRVCQQGSCVDPPAPDSAY